MFEASDDLWFISWERFFGGEGIVRYPFSRFTFLQGSLAVGGSHTFVLDEARSGLR